MILAMLAIKAYILNSKINPSEKLPPVGIEPGTLGLAHLVLHKQHYSPSLDLGSQVQSPQKVNFLPNLFWSDPARFWQEMTNYRKRECSV